MKFHKVRTLYPFFWLCIALLSTVFVSCTSQRKLNYFNNLQDTTYVALPPVIEEERVIQKGDRIEILFTARDQDAAGTFNRQMNTGAASQPVVPTTPKGHEYLVDSAGMIELPILKLLEVKGLTAAQLKLKLTKLVSPYLIEPVVDVKFNSFLVTILGEVRSPGTFNIGGNMRFTVFEALAAAGDLPHEAKKYNLKLYRDYNGQRYISEINLTDKSLLYNKQTFLVKPNDVIYVETRRGSIFREDFGLIASVVTLVVSVVTLGFTIAN